MVATPRGAHHPPTYDVAARPGARGKTWSDEEEGPRKGDPGHSCCTRFKFAIWLGTVGLLVSFTGSLLGGQQA